MSDVRKTAEETVRLLRDVAASKGDDFRVRIVRKRTPSALPEQVATLEGAKVEQLMAPEGWLPSLAGGGPEFQLSIYHATDKTERLGDIVVNIVGEPRNADPRVAMQSNWLGPPIVVYPRPPAPDDSSAPMYSIPNVSSGTGGAVPRTEPGGGAGGHAVALAATVQAQYEDLDRQKRKVVETERSLAEQRKNIEVEAARAQGRSEVQRVERDLADARAQVARAINAPAVTTPGESLGSILKEVLPPLVKMYSDSQLEASRQRMELAKMQMESQRELAKIQQASQDKLTELMIQNANRPLIPPELKDVLFKDKDEAAGKAMAQVVDAMGTMTNMTMNVMAQVAEMNLGGHGEEEGGGALKIIREGLKTVMAFSQAAAARQANQLPGGPQAALSAGERRRREALQARKAQLEARQRAAATRPPVPESKPNGAETRPAGFAGISEPEAKVPEAKTTALDEVISAIRERAESADAVAEQILAKASQDDGSLANGVTKEYDGDFASLFADKLGDEWLDEEGNVEYLDAVIRAVALKGVQAGIFDTELLEHLDELTSSLYDDEDAVEDAKEEKSATP